MKRIIILCDGTWNIPDKIKGSLPVATNVVKVAEAIESTSNGVRQLVLYDPGVGVQGSILKRSYEGAIGKGMSDNILQAYRYLVDKFEPGDEIFLFGFSRGAFTVRSLAGMIRNSGILHRAALNMLDDAYALYRSRSPSAHPREREATLFRRTYAAEDVTPITFMGVWDTVGALGNPLYLGGLAPKHRFHDATLSKYVKAAYHALAVDETRRNFAPILWHQKPDAEGQLLEQRWFPGAHANIGGGVTDTSLSDLAASWLISKAKDAGLGLTNIRFAADPLGPIAQSRKGMYKLLPEYFRQIDQHDVQGPTREVVDRSVIIRFNADPSYRPANLVDFFRRFPRAQEMGENASDHIKGNTQDEMKGRDTFW